jgi:CheY-like chemotaxis protein
MNGAISPILLIEDRAVDLDLTKRAFARRQMFNPVQVARDGEEALGYIRRWDEGETPPVLILLDLKLPKVSGLEFLRQIKTHPRFSAIPVIVLTASAEDRDIEEAYRLGCNSYVVKPVAFNRFAEIALQIEGYWCALNTTPR